VARVLAYVTGTVNRRLLLQNEWLSADNPNPNGQRRTGRRRRSVPVAPCSSSDDRHAVVVRGTSDAKRMLDADTILRAKESPVEEVDHSGPPPMSREKRPCKQRSNFHLRRDSRRRHTVLDENTFCAPNTCIAPH
jgi:hypothetical protein